MFEQCVSCLFVDGTCLPICTSKLQAGSDPPKFHQCPLLFSWLYASKLTVFPLKIAGKSRSLTNSICCFAQEGHAQHQNDLPFNGKWFLVNGDVQFCWLFLTNQISRKHHVQYISNTIMNFMVNLDGQLGSLSLRFFLQTKTPKKNQLQRL